MTKQEFRQLLCEEKLLLLDGAMGTNLYKAGMPKGCCVEEWELKYPGIVLKLQKAYVDAGARILYAPTFGANRLRLEKYGVAGSIADFNERLVELSRQAAADQAYVAGDLASTGVILEELGGDVSREELFDIYREQAMLLCKAGCDLFTIETMTSVREAEIAVDAVQSVCAYPIICTLSVRKDGSAYFGGNLFDGATRMQQKEIDAYGINCCSGFDGLEVLIRKLKTQTDLPIVAKPNAGMPHLNARGDYVYDYSPASFVYEMSKLIEAGATLIGGCCGTDPTYIRKLKQECTTWHHKF